MTNSSPYLYEFDPAGDSTAAKVVRNVGHSKKILELGCAYGVMTKVFSEYSCCNVFGIEFDENSAQSAKPYCDELAVLDIENADWEKVLGDRRFDVIVAADVLEHLREPQKCIVALKPFLTPDGYFVFSIPNVAHNGIIAELLNDDFRYRKTGLLDATHLRFWGYEGLKRLLLESDLVMASVETTCVAAEKSEFSEVWASLPHWLAEALRSRQNGDVYQYVIKANSAESLESCSLVQSAKISLLPIVTPIEDIFVEERDNAVTERDHALMERDHALMERDHALMERDHALMERDHALALINQMKQGVSWRLTRPLRFAARLRRYGLLAEDRQQLTQFAIKLRHRYHRLPLPEPVKRLVSLLYKSSRKMVRVLRRTALHTLLFHAPLIKPIKNANNTMDYIVWGVIDWRFRYQRPQQLAQTLAQVGRRVFYVSPDFVDDDRAGFEVDTLDASGALFQVRLFLKGAPVIYSTVPEAASIQQLRSSIGEVLVWANCTQIVSLVDHPFWYGVASVLPNSRLIYDCMDHHEGFGNNTAPLLQLEKQLLSEGDLTITTSSWLDESIAPFAHQRVLIRNAGDYKHFSAVPDKIYRDSQGRRIIGYYGAIAEWFDLDLIEAVALQHPDCCVLLIGADTINAKSRLAALPNVTFTGEVSYGQLPYYLHGFDVCLLPFKVIPLTLATNPVKAYEYLSAGKPVVAIELPEMVQFDGLVYTVSGQNAFLAAVSKVISQSEPPELVQQRKIFAQGQTWQHRAATLIESAESVASNPAVSIIVVTYNNIDLTRACLSSLHEYSLYEPLEIIVVDNASADGSPAFLSEWVTNGKHRKLILNTDNRGFAAANNQGLATATGDYLVMLNNDTYVTPGWIRTLVRHLQRDQTIGLIGPVTNNIGNEAKIDITYKNMDEMLIKSADYTCRHIGQIYPLTTAAFFCVMMSRNTYESVGPLDEVFGRGFFEDDDYCRRVEQIGLRIVCAEDVFIHHHLSASFNKLKWQDRQKLFEENKKIYEAKWGEWIAHNHRR